MEFEIKFVAQILKSPTYVCFLKYKWGYVPAKYFIAYWNHIRSKRQITQRILEMLRNANVGIK